MKSNRKPMLEELVDPGIDYAENMFADGNNRANTDRRISQAPRYDRAAHMMDATMTDMLVSEAEPERGNTISRSRDGTEASGSLDEDGGSLGGTSEELDALEAGGTPVDRNPRMKG